MTAEFSAAGNCLAERAVIGCCLRGDRWADQVLTLVTEEDFIGEPRCADVLAAVRALRGRGVSVDPLLVHGQLLRDGKVSDSNAPTSANYLIDLENACWHPGNVRYYVAEMLEAAVRVRALEAAARVAQAAERVGSDHLGTLAAESLSAILVAQARVAAVQSSEALAA